MSRLPIRLRLAVVFGIVMAVIFTAVGASLYFRLAATLNTRISDSLESRTTALATVVREAGGARNLDPGLIGGEDGVAQVIGPDGSLVVAVRRSHTVSSYRRSTRSGAKRRVTIERSCRSVIRSRHSGSVRLPLRIQSS
jgi:hypothetical protein